MTAFYRTISYMQHDRWVGVILYLMLLILAMFACDISVGGNNLATPTNQQIVSMATGSPTATMVNPSFECVVNTASLNVRSCQSTSCNNIGNWALEGKSLTVTKISADKNWYFVKEYNGWIRNLYCTKK